MITSKWRDGMKQTLETERPPPGDALGITDEGRAPLGFRKNVVGLVKHARSAKTMLSLLQGHRDLEGEDVQLLAAGIVHGMLGEAFFGISPNVTPAEKLLLTLIPRDVMLQTVEALHDAKVMVNDDELSELILPIIKPFFARSVFDGMLTDVIRNLRVAKTAPVCAPEREVSVDGETGLC